MMEKISVPESWEKVLEKLKNLKTPAVIIIIGGTDTGKSVFSQFLARGLAESGKVALVDADLGQSTIGPPTTVGLAVSRGRKGVLKTVCLRFVGSTSPAGHMLQTLVAVKKLTEKAKGLKAGKIVIDTSGFIFGPVGQEFKFQKINLVNPTHIITLERRKELDELLKNFAQNRSVRIQRIKVSAETARIRTARQRRLYREKKFKAYFKDAKRRSLPLVKLGLHGIIPDLKKKKKWKNLLVGLCDEENNTLSLGIIQNIYLSKGLISCITTIEKKNQVKTIQFGSVYLDKDGRQL